MTNPIVAPLGRPIRLAVGGGAPPSAIGPVHRAAARLDGCFDVVAGVPSSNPEKGRAAGLALGLAPARSYGTVAEMLRAEASRDDGIEAVAVMTPNDSHYAIVKAAIAAGLDVMCDKPLANDAAEADELARDAAAAGIASAITHTYAGYPMLRQARALVAAGAIGALRLVQVEYLGGSLATRVEDQPDAPRRWKHDPARGGPSLVLGDLGTHAHHLVCYVAGERVVAVNAEVGSLLPERRLHDYTQVRLRLAGGARGAMTVSAGAAAADNEIMLRAFGSRGHVEWRNREHGFLTLALIDGTRQVFARGAANLAPLALRGVALKRPGHPEGILEAFANLYADFAAAIVARRLKQPLDPLAASVPTLREGADGVRFVAAALRSQAAGQAWVEL